MAPAGDIMGTERPKSKSSNFATLRQFGDELPLPGGAHGYPFTDLDGSPQATGTVPLRVQSTDFGTGGLGTFLALRERRFTGMHGHMMSHHLAV